MWHFLRFSERLADSLITQPPELYLNNKLNKMLPRAIYVIGVEYNENSQFKYNEPLTIYSNI
jgi:hypothetical protein